MAQQVCQERAARCVWGERPGPGELMLKAEVVG
jgi:hypothetical protein